uniref:Uncharacterized protein n=1 Tax=Anguilla anguilla TaxID=7936 RepID=A0A0E9XNX5_ANGAN
MNSAVEETSKLKLPTILLDNQFSEEH